MLNRNAGAKPGSTVLLLALLIPTCGDGPRPGERLSPLFDTLQHATTDSAINATTGLAPAPYSGMLHRQADSPRPAITTAALVDALDAEPVFLAADAAGTLDHALPTARFLDSLPYLSAVAAPVGTPHGGGYIRGVNLIYPLYVTDRSGGIVDSIMGEPTAADIRIDYGQFMPGDSLAWRDYLAHLRIVTGLASIADSVLVINRGRFNDTVAHRVVHETLDVFVNGRRIIDGAASPGEILGFSSRSIFFLQRDGAHRATGIAEYRWRH